MSLNSGRVSDELAIIKTSGIFPFSAIFNFVSKFKGSNTTQVLASTVTSMKTLPYYLLPTPTKVKLASTSSADNATGTGARLIVLTGLDEFYNIKEELITLTGSTPVETALTWSRVQELTIVTYGTNKDAVTGDSKQVGDIWCGTGTFTSGVPINKLVVIDALENDPNSRVGIFTVPENYVLIINGFKIYSNLETRKDGNSFVSIALGFHLFGFPNTVWFKTNDFYVNWSTSDKFLAPVYLPPKTDVQLRVFTNSSNNTTSIIIECELKELRV